MDYEHVFDQLEISPDPFAICELTGVCDLKLGRDTAATLHYVLHGCGALKMRGHRDVIIQPGTIILVPGLQSHTLCSQADDGNMIPDCKPAELRLQHVLETGKDPTRQGQLIALCARVRVGLRGAEDIVDLIRSPLIETVSDDSQLRPAIDLLLRELSAPTTGSRAIIQTVLTLCMIEMLRRKLQGKDSALRWMAALRDPQVWDALHAMLDAPGDPHTVDSLAERVGMSRSAFASRFSQAYGSGPIELLRDLRLRKAAALLRDSDLPVKRIAHMVGFTSRTAFSRLFDERTGLSPIQFRKKNKDSGR